MVDVASGCVGATGGKANEAGPVSTGLSVPRLGEASGARGKAFCIVDSAAHAAQPWSARA